MAEAEDLDDDFEDDETESGVIRKLRRDNRVLAKRAKQADEFEAEIAQSKREKALSAPDLAKLSDKQRQALAKVHDGDFTAEALKQTAIDLGWLEDTEQNEIDDELDRSEKVTQASQTGKTARSTGVLKPEDTAGWSMERMLRLKDSNPEAFEALKRGESVVAAGIV